MGRLAESFQNDLLRDLGSLGAIGMAAHAVDNDQQRRVLTDRNRDAVLVLLAPAQEADVGVVDPQEEFHASVRLSRALYHPAADERSFRLHKVGDPRPGACGNDYAPSLGSKHDRQHDRIRSP